MSKAKKKGKKGKKAKKKDGDGLELSLEEKFKKTTQEVDILKQQLAERQEYAQRSKSSELSIQQKLEAAKASLLEEKLQTKDLAFDLTRQYKTLQIYYEQRVQELEMTNKKLSEKLDSTEEKLRVRTLERDQLQKDKDKEVSTLNTQIEFIQTKYETIIKETVDGLANQLEKSRMKWESDSLDDADLMAQKLLKSFGNPR